MNLKVGLVLNPKAGIGGPVALKGSDGAETVSRAHALGSESKVVERATVCLNALHDVAGKLEIITMAGEMGAKACQAANMACTVVGEIAEGETTPEDTRRAVESFLEHDVDLILFAGGDGTARDICDVLEQSARQEQVVLGIPCGVKMHSGVFANTPAAAAAIVAGMARGDLLTVGESEVRDIDEDAFRRGIVSTKYYGEMYVPEELRYMQQVKSGGQEVEELVVDEIAAHVMDNMESDVVYFIGSGSTTAAIMEALGLENTLLGVDVVKDGELLLTDAREDQLYDYVCNEDVRIVVTVIGGQGHVFGRGNQQLSARILNKVGKENIMVIATKTKLESLQGPLLTDTGDADLDHALGGFIRVITGYEDAVLCKIQ